MEKCAVVTGASKGIGLEIARKLSEEGYQVFGLSRTEGPLREVTWISCDVTDSRSVSDGFAEVLRAAGRIDVLVANAGMGISWAAEGAPEADYRRQCEVNDLSLIHISCIIAPLLTLVKQMFRMRSLEKIMG